MYFCSLDCFKQLVQGPRRGPRKEPPKAEQYEYRFEERGLSIPSCRAPTRGPQDDWIVHGVDIGSVAFTRPKMQLLNANRRLS
jgi:hypothetical protein